MDCLKGIAIVIPAYEASAELGRFIDELLKTDVSAIIVVDDGSIFFPVAGVLSDVSDPRLTLLVHLTNKGKGRALKTGFEYVLADSRAEFRGVMTADADGQHLIKDVLTVAAASMEEPTNVAIGSRTFTKSDVPARSRFGNILTRAIFKIATGVPIQDTQSGLRYLPRGCLSMICQLSGERYEFELRALKEIANQGIGISQPEISTTYIDGNKSSHFRPLVDSARIYVVFIRFCAVSVLSALIDLMLFGLLIASTQSILTSTYAARVCSASFNFYGNRIVTFGAGLQKYSITAQAGMYIALAFLSASLSALLLQFVGTGSIFYLVLAKAIIDIGLFILNFGAQKVLIFRADRHIP